MSALYASLTPATAAVLFLALGALGAAAALAIRQRWLGSLRLRADRAGVATLYGGAIGTIFALVFAFAIVTVWQNYDRASAAVDQEADVLHNLHRTLDAYPGPVREAGHALLRAYLRQVVVAEWPLLADGREDPAARDLLARLGASLARYQPGPGEAPLHGQALHLLEQARNLRHDRIRAGAAYLDPTMWLSLLLGSGILLGFACLLDLPSRLQHQLMQACLGASIGVTFYLITTYNWPFYGPGKVAPTPLAALQDELQATP